MTSFDPTIRVGPGITVLEASAGTGKTHAVASIVVHEVAEGRPIGELLVVTFTRKATGTLRDRVWHRLGAAATALEERRSEPDLDPLVEHLKQGSSELVAARVARLRRALSDFDAATIATTHGFCQQVLASLGVAGDAEREVEVVEDVADLVRDAVDDLFVRRFHAGTDAPLFPRKVAESIARAVVENPDAEIAPVDQTPESKLRARFARSVRERVIEQKRRGRLVTYDDLLGRLAASIDDPVRGSLVTERLRRRFSMAIVDEFQDTDAIQWQILERAFAMPPCRMVVVGDPKQAIYAFRGGDVHAYLAATKTHPKLDLDVSWRADQGLLDGLDAVLGGAQLGDPSIRHRALVARPGANEPRLVGDTGAPLTFRLLVGQKGKKDPLRAAVRTDVADEVVRLLAARATIVQRDHEGAPDEGHPVQARDIAILVRRNWEGEEIRAELARRGVPAVVHGGAGVLATPAARSWVDLLRAIEVPSSTQRVRSLAFGSFVGWSAATIATAGDDDWEVLDGWLHDWSVGLRLHGVAGLLRRIEDSVLLTARLHGQVGGERVLADLRHVAELAHERLSSHPSSVSVLAGWLVEQIAEARTTESGDARRRLESDAEAVTIQTIHSAKGLEFPIVLLPSLWEDPWRPDGALPTFHGFDGRRLLSVGAPGQPLHLEHATACEREADEEELRLLYVSLTRAQHRVIAWWAAGRDAGRSAFARILLGRDPITGLVPQRLRRSPNLDDVRAALEVLQIATPGAIGIEDVGGTAPSRLLVNAPPRAALLAAAVFDRGFDARWVRTSYSALTAKAHDAGPALRIDDPPVESVTVDEPLGDVEEPAVGAVREPDPADPLLAEVIMGPLMGGPEVGTLVHQVLERVDFAAADLAAAVIAAIDAPARTLLGTGEPLVVDGLVAALTTPLGPLFDGRALCDLEHGDRLNEMAFDLPLAGGDSPLGFVTMDAIADVFAAHLAADDPLADYHLLLRDPVVAAEIRGFLSGSIDLVARLGRDGGDQRYVVVDYKTNRLAPSAEVLTSWHYRPAALADAMQDAHYPLQAAIYEVALHRYLRWRLPAYEPGRHLGGVAYLFLRGMTGPDTPCAPGATAPCGVFAWRPPASFVLALSDLLDAGAPGSAAAS